MWVSAQARNMTIARRLWDISCDLLGIPLDWQVVAVGPKRSVQQTTPCSLPKWLSFRVAKPWAQREQISGLGSFLREAPCALPGIATPCICPDRLCSPPCQLLEISQDKYPLGTTSSSVPSETHHLGEPTLWQGWFVAVWTRFYPLCSRCIVSQPNNLHLERATLPPELNPGVTLARLAQEQLVPHLLRNHRRANIWILSGNVTESGLWDGSLSLWQPKASAQTRSHA